MLPDFLSVWNIYKNEGFDVFTETIYQTSYHIS